MAVPGGSAHAVKPDYTTTGGTTQVHQWGPQKAHQLLATTSISV